MRSTRTEVDKLVADCSYGRGKFVIVYQGQRRAGVIYAYNSARHLGAFTYEGAVAHAKSLAMTHNDTIYVVAKVGDAFSMSKDQYEDLKKEKPDWETFGDLYSAAGCATDEKASRLLDIDVIQDD
jgi:hypothetical protein